MTVLTNNVRDEVRTKLLKEAFEPKFTDLRNRIAQHAREWLHVNHPVFEELLARRDAARYLDKRPFYMVRIGMGTAKIPSYDDSVNHYKLKIDEVLVPTTHADDFYLIDDTIVDEYRCLWERYKNASLELFKVLRSYRTREKLLVDFPEYEKYLPAIEVKKLPALIPGEARAKLSALGIPACNK
jgi:hypothetical protein